MNTENKETEKQCDIHVVVVSEAEFCRCGSQLKPIQDEYFCPNVDCFARG